VRIWTLHPKYLDRQGLLACWRESLLAQKVLKGKTKGYRQHPQLVRFRAQPDPLSAIAAYLVSLADEAARRGYTFDRMKISPERNTQRIQVTRGQLLYEWEHLKAKLLRRDPARYRQMIGIETPEPHPLFEIVEGDIEPWEKTL
jgi:Pyrimidine dimer DNA glycosylase